jgi:hypothetical protein
VTKQTKEQNLIKTVGAAWNKQNTESLALSTTYINETYKLHITNNCK